MWTSSLVTTASQDESTKQWTVTVKRADESSRILHPAHLVFAVGIGGGLPNVPVYPGTEDFAGQILHSSQYAKASDYVGKKVVVVGACTSGECIHMNDNEMATAIDESIYVRSRHLRGFLRTWNRSGRISHPQSYCSQVALTAIFSRSDVTMFQRGPTYVMSMKNAMIIMEGAYLDFSSSDSTTKTYFPTALYSENAPPTHIADMMSASFPNKLLKLVNQRVTRYIAEADKYAYFFFPCAIRR